MPKWCARHDGYSGTTAGEEQVRRAVESGLIKD
jgi:hypothetical protein